MSLSSASLGRFRARVDTVLAELFPVTLVIGADLVQASGPGGRTVTQFEDAGQPESFRFPFRMAASEAPTGWAPTKGASIGWKVSASLTIPMEIHEVSTRPHEDRFAFTCKKRRVTA